jgi:hypothetical protein
MEKIKEKNTVFYINGGDKYVGMTKNDTMRNWRSLAKKWNYKYIYKGYRYFDNEREQVVIFDDKCWTNAEIEKRKKNGFKGIKCHSIFYNDI